MKINDPKFLENSSIFAEAVVQMCSVEKKVFLKVLYNSQEAPVLGSLFVKMQAYKDKKESPA